MPVLTIKRVAFAFGALIAAATVLFGYAQRDIFVVLLGMSLGIGGLALLAVGVYRRAGYLIVLENQNSAYAGARFSRMLTKQGELIRQVRDAEIGELRPLVLNAFRETVERCDEIDDKASHLLEHQQRASRGDEYLKNALGTLGRRMQEDVEALKASVQSSGQESSREVVLLEQAISSVHQAVEKTSTRISALKEDSLSMSEGVKSLIASELRPVKELTVPLGRVEKSIAALRYSVINDSSSLSTLLQRFPPRAVLPEFSGWALEPTSIAHLVELVMQHRPRLVVECGSGVSTLWLAYALEETGGRLISLEHLDGFARTTRDELQRHGLAHIAEVRSAGLEEFRIGENIYQWYARSAWESLEQIDLLIVDGPPKAVGSRARYPALPLLQGALSGNAVVVLDDVHRKEEKQIFDLWKSEFKEIGSEFQVGPRTLAARWAAS